MADQPDKTPVTPDSDPAPEQQAQPDQSPQTQDTRTPDRGTGWHEPPVPEGSSRPVNVEAWFQPDDAETVEPEEAETETEATTDELPAGAPAQSGAWYTPPDAALDALFSGADETIAEVHEPAAPPQATRRMGETQPQDATGTESQLASDGWSAPESGADEAATRVLSAAEDDSVDEAIPDGSAEPAPDAESTPTPEATEPQAAGAELTPAEAAMLSEEPESSALPERPARDDELQTEAEVHTPAEAAPATEAPSQPSQFKQVEQKVQVLRERFSTGHLTRDQLQAELRRLMILGDDGHWWMLGLETHQWYYYDGHDWVAATPPGYEEEVQGSSVRTETGMQEVAGAADGYFDLPQSDQSGDQIAIDGEEDDIPLPRRVPQEDPAATLVSPNTPFLESVRSPEAATESGARKVDADQLASIEHPGGDQGLPERPDRAETGFGDQTIRSEAFSEQATMPGGTSLVAQQQGVQQQQQSDAVVIDSARDAAVQAAKPKPRMGEFPQPDYSVALGPERNRNFYVKWGIRLTVFGVIGGMALALIALLAMIGYYLYQVDRYRDAVDDLSARAADFENTIIYNTRGDELAVFSNPNTGLRTEVPLPEISPWLIHATISTENETFYSDPGFSILAIMRATVQNLQAGNTVSGASTITQQLARALVLETEFASQRTTERKIVEIIVASEIKRQYSKNEILEIYLNEIFYGNFAYGIEAAAQTYFGKSAGELNPVEAAFLAGLPQSPARYDPVVNREESLARMEDVLRLMSEANGTGCVYIGHQDATEWTVPEGGGLCVKAETQSDGTVAYFYKTPATDWTELFVELAIVKTTTFSAPAIEFKHPHFVNYVWQQLERTYGPQAIYSAGYRVYTTLDEDLQIAAEGAVAANLKRVRDLGYPANNSSVIAIRPSDGAVLAMVGSADYYDESIKGQVNVAFTAQQPGSTLKPFIYLSAFQPDDEGEYLTPASVIWDVETDFGGYKPVNYDRQFHGPLTVRDTLARSLNIPAVKALEYTGLLRFTELMTRAGVEFPGGNPVEVGAGLPTALGSQDVQLFDLTAAYAMLANGGRKVEPYSIVLIEDSDQNLVYEATPVETPQVVSPQYAYLITDILTDSEARAAEFGRGDPMELDGGRPVAVKTGTSNDSRDVWTMGYTPQIAVGVWVGTTDNEEMYNPTGYPTYYLTGYYGAAPLWNAVMEAALAGTPVQPFQPPAGLIQEQVCLDSGTIPSEACAGRTQVEYFASEAPPPGPDEDIFKTLMVDTYTNTLASDACMDYAESVVYVDLDDQTAYTWINSTAEGQSWAAQRGIDTPVQQPPTTYCDPSVQRPYADITFPVEGATASGVVEVRGSVIMPEFYRYEIRYAVGHEPTSFSSPEVVQETARPETNAVLGLIDTQTWADGPYTLRLVALDLQGRSVTEDVHITVSNAAIAPTAPVIPTPTLAPTLTPSP